MRAAHMARDGTGPAWPGQPSVPWTERSTSDRSGTSLSPQWRSTPVHRSGRRKRRAATISETRLPARSSATKRPRSAAGTSPRAWIPTSPGSSPAPSRPRKTCNPRLRRGAIEARGRLRRPLSTLRAAQARTARTRRSRRRAPWCGGASRRSDRAGRASSRAVPQRTSDNVRFRSWRASSHTRDCEERATWVWRTRSPDTANFAKCRGHLPLKNCTAPCGACTGCAGLLGLKDSPFALLGERRACVTSRSRKRAGPRSLAAARLARPLRASAVRMRAARR